jgi:hypothetical protein
VIAASSFTNGNELSMLTHEKKAQLDAKYPAPENIKTASVDHDYAKLSGLAAFFSYADPRNKQYPVASAAATWYSACQAHEQKQAGKALPAEIMSEIERRLGLFQLKEAFAKATAAPAAVSDAEYALRTEGNDGVTYTLFPVDDIPAAIKSASQLIESRKKLTLKQAREAASRIQAKLAGTLIDPDVEDYLDRMAGKGFPSHEVVREEMLKRAAILEARGQPKELVETVRSAASDASRAIHDSPQVKLAYEQTIEDLDRKHGLQEFWGTALRAPEVVANAFLLHEIKAAADDYIGFSSGSFFKRSDINKHAEKLSARFPGIFTSDLGQTQVMFSKAASVVGVTLQDEIILESFLLENKCAAYRLGIPPEKLRQFQGK